MSASWWFDLCECEHMSATHGQCVGACHFAGCRCERFRLFLRASDFKGRRGRRRAARLIEAHTAS